MQRVKQSEERWLISRWRWGSGARSIGEWVRLLEEAGDRIYRRPWLDVFANRFLRTFTVEPRAAVDQLVLQRAKKLAVTALMPRAVGAALFWPRTRSFGLAWASAERRPPRGCPAGWIGRVSPGVTACPGEFALLFLVDLGTAWSSGAGQ